MKNKNEAVKEITAKLEQGVQDMFNSGEYADYLAFMAKFYNYSANNCLLIWMQKPDASLVAGYKAWQTKFGRQVRKGEKGIKILAPIPKKFKTEVVNKDGETEEREVNYVGFRAISVFDVTQTEGDEIPSIVKRLEGDLYGFQELYDKIIGVAPVPVEISEINGSANGYYSPTEKVIRIKKGMSDVQTIKTAVHEVAHSMLHGKGNDLEDASRKEAEVQAESVAYTVCQYLGIDTSEYSFGYVTGWSSGKQVKELTSSMEVIRKTACTIIEGIAA